MCSNESGEEEASLVCAGCVGEAYLKEQIQSTGSEDCCSYCENDAMCIELQELANHVEQAFETHFEVTATDPDGFEYSITRESGSGWERSGEEAKWAIMNAIDTSEDLAEDLRQILADRHFSSYAAEVGEESPFGEEVHYIEKDPGKGEFPYLWKRFEAELATEARFFTRNARMVLERIFENIENLQTVSGDAAIIDAGPNTEINHLFRARVFRNEEEKLNEALAYPWSHLGAPPANFAAAGRMNARGISVFYGAREPETALAEVRPPVGSDVAIACFNLIRPLRLLNLNALQSIAAGGSVFNPTTIELMQRASFLAILGQKMAGPVMPHEEESRYLPTQVVSEYLATELNLDGIVFPSVQAGNGAINVVLFHHAARVQEHPLPPGTEVSSSLSCVVPDEPPTEYSVWEELPNISPEQTNTQAGPLFSDLGPAAPVDYRLETLSIELESVQVRHICALSFQSEQFSVRRTRFARNPNIANMR